MFDFFKRLLTNKSNLEKTKKDEFDGTVEIISTHLAVESSKISTITASKTFEKPLQYDRRIIDDGSAKRNIKTNTFESSSTVVDPYTEKPLKLTKSEAKSSYGESWTNHLAESDHIIPLEKRYEKTKNNPWLTNENIKASSNSKDNFEVVSRKFNNVKRSRSNEKLVNDDNYLNEKKLYLSDDAKSRAIESERRANRALRNQDIQDSFFNIAKTANDAGIDASKESLEIGTSVSTISNIVAVLKGNKTPMKAIKDTFTDSGKAAVTGYCVGGSLTTINHTLTNSKSSFLRGLSKSGVPNHLLTLVMATGQTLKRYGNGEITTQECLIELGERGLNVATVGYSMAVGQSVIPIPVIGGAIGALVGSVLTSKYYNKLIKVLQNKELEHQERMKIIAECKRAASNAKAYRQELENYLNSYFKEFKNCFDEALTLVHISFQQGDVDGVIAGANQITRKLGGEVRYDNMEEFKSYLSSSSTDIL